MNYTLTANNIIYDIKPSLTGAFAITVLSLLNQLILNLNYIGRYDQYPNDFSETLLNNTTKIQFDFIIIGGGTSGCILANRLTQINKWDVLLIEAGDYPSATTEVPMFHTTLKNSKEDWKFQTEQSPNICQGTVNKQCTISKGKVLGGTSTIGNMHLVHLNNRLSDEIKSIQSNQSNYIKNVLTTFYDDMNANYINLPLTIKYGTRFNMAKNFLSSIRNRTNLYLIKNSLVQRLYTKSPDLNKIRGVEVLINNKLIKIEAKKEIILTTGAIMTPKLLIHSGIGPKNLLDQFHITPIISNLNQVGKNFHGHLTVPIFLLNPNQQNQMDLSIFEYIMTNSGKFSTTNINDFVTFLNKRTIAIYHHYFIKHDIFLEFYLNGLNYHPAIITSIIKANRNYDLILLMISLIKPKSRNGEILISSNDPKDDPVIVPNYFCDENNEDFSSLIISINKILSNTKFKSLEIDIPNCRNFKFCTSHYLQCYIKNMAYPLSDIAGTAIIGRGTNQDWVVDDNLLVKDVRGLRIADESILPHIIEGNTLTTVAAISDVAAELIKERWIENYLAKSRISHYLSQ